MTVPTKQSVSSEVLATFGLAVSITSILANTVVLVVLILARRQYGSSVNIFIINQTAMDLCIDTLIVMYVDGVGGDSGTITEILGQLHQIGTITKLGH